MIKRSVKIGLGIISTPIIVYGVYKVNVDRATKEKVIHHFLSKKNIDFNSIQAKKSSNSKNELALNISVKPKNYSRFLETKNQLNSSNITDGENGTIFEDSQKNLWSMGKGTKLQVKKATSDIWETDISSNITDGENGTIFEDSSGNLWSMGDGTKLQVKTANSNTWNPADTSSNITDGENGTIFEDSQKNLWSMGKGTKLQVKKATSDIWETDIFSNITDGENGTIFEDSHNNLWSMGIGTKLQVKKSTSDTWETDPSSNITSGWGGTIFEDSQKNLWSMGYRTKLQVKKATSDTWETDPSSNITGGENGTIFEDSHNNLWSMAYGTKLQVKKSTSDTWETDPSSNITSGWGGTIFEDSQKNLWSMGTGTKLQVKKSTSDTWETDPSSNITGGENGTIFEDSSGNLWSMGDETKLQVRNQEIFHGWINNNLIFFRKSLFLSSNITDGQHGTIFEDSSRNLWSMGFGTKLQVKKATSNTWKPADPSSNITDGENGTIFEDSQKNLWSMGRGTKLQVKKATSNTWKPADTSSNITDGEGGTIFEDSSGNLWSMGYGTKLQVKMANSNTWNPADTSSNITGGENGTIFEDSHNNLWSMAYGTKLQVKKSTSDTWETDPSSNITSGWGGTIFEDSQKNLWSMGSGTKLQVKAANSDTWAEDPSSNITSGWGGTIFEDSHNNLWSMGIGTKLQVKKSTSDTWETDPSSNITDGENGTIFEDSSGNLWSMGFGTKLQVKMANSNTWAADPSSSIINGYGGTIFEDSQKNLWSMGYGSKLNVKLKKPTPIKTKLDIVTSYKLTTKPDRINDRFIIKGDYSYYGHYIKLVYKLVSNNDWEGFDRSGVSKKAIKPGKYEFKWIMNSDLVLASSQDSLPKISNIKVIDVNSDNWKIIKDQTTTSYAGAKDGKITLPTNLPNGITVQVTKNGAVVTDLNHLEPGTYKVRYILDSAYILKRGSLPKIQDITIIKSTLIGLAVPTDFKTTTTDPTYKSATDATIKVTTTIPSGATLQYQKDGKATWTDVPTNGLTGLTAGTYHFKYVLDAAHVWIGGVDPKLDDVIIAANSKDGIVVPTDFNTTKTIPTYKGATDATINITTTIPSGATLQYQKVGETNWADVPTNGLTGLTAGTYHFKYVLDATHAWIGGVAPTLNDVVVNANSKDGVAVPTDFKTTTTIPTYKNAADATIKVTTTIPTGSKLQYQKDGEAKWVDVPANGITDLSPGTYHFQYVLDATHVWIGGVVPKLNGVVINANSKDGVVVPTFNTTKTIPTYKGATDATINVTTTIPTGSKLQYQKVGETNWTDVPTNGITGLAAGTYHFQYVLDATHVWIGGVDPKLDDVIIAANSKDGIVVPTDFNTTKTIPTYKGATDATINITTTIPSGATLQYQKDGESTWTDVPTNGITGLSPGTYHFQYVLDATHVWIGGSAPTLNDILINANSKDGVAVPTDFKTTTTDPTYKGAADAKISITSKIPAGLKVQYQKDGESTWTDVPKDKVVKNLSSGIYHFKYVLKDKDNYVWIKGEPQKVIDIRVVKHQTKSKKLLYGIGIGVALLTILPSIYMVIRKRRKAKLF